MPIPQHRPWWIPPVPPKHIASAFLDASAINIDSDVIIPSYRPIHCQNGIPCACETISLPNSRYKFIHRYKFNVYVPTEFRIFSCLFKVVAWNPAHVSIIYHNDKLCQFTYIAHWADYLLFIDPILYVKHYNDVIVTAMASQITSLTIVYSAVYSDAD